MTDRELLEAAAMAIGLWPSPEPFEHVLGSWNPLTDDGDALRLAVKLKIPLQFPDFQDIARTCGPEGDMSEYIEAALEHNGDLAAAVRTAIVRAAAAIWGKP